MNKSFNLYKLSLSTWAWSWNWLSPGTNKSLLRKVVAPNKGWFRSGSNEEHLWELPWWKKIYSLFMYILWIWCVSCYLCFWYKATDHFFLALVCLLIRLIQKYTCIQTQVSLFNGVFLFQIDLEKCTRNGSTWCGNRWWKRYKFVCTITLVWNYCVLVNEVD